MEEHLNSHEHLFRSMVGGLAYLATCTRPDITFAVSSLARHLHSPTHRHILLVKRIMRYLNGTKQHGLFFSARSPLHHQSLRAAVHADWGGDMETRRSTSGFIIAVNGALIYWRSKRQSLVTLSSGEAEYVALSSCSREVSWIRKKFWEMATLCKWDDNSKMDSTVIEIDSTVALLMGQLVDAMVRTKYIDLKYHHVRELLFNKIVSLSKVPTNEQVADCLTKAGNTSIILKMVRAFNLDSMF